MLRKILQDNIKTFNKNWGRNRKTLCLFDNFVEQFMYIYDNDKIYQDGNGFDNLELYSELLQRLDISNLRLQWCKMDCSSCFFVCIYKEKGDYYIEYKSNGLHKKVWLSMWVQNYKVIEKKKIFVEIDWV